MGNVKSIVNGWKQAIKILRDVSDGLSFTMAEIESEHLRNPRAFGTDQKKAVKFAKAKTNLLMAQRYLRAMEDAALKQETAKVEARG